MKKRILIFSAIIILFGLAAFSLADCAIDLRVSQESTAETFKVLARQYDQNRQPDNEYAAELSARLSGEKTVAVVFLGSDGSVLGAGEVLANQSQTDEFVAAVQSGEGWAVRRDGSQNVVHYCKRISVDGSPVFVRLSTPSQGYFQLYSVYLREKITFLALIWIISFLLVVIVTTVFFAPLGRLSEGLTTPEAAYKYGDLRRLTQRLDAYAGRVQYGTGVLDVLEDGVVVLSPDMEVLLINRRGTQLFGCKEQDYLTFFEGDREFGGVLSQRQDACVYKSLNGRNYAFEFVFDEAICVIVTDVTVQRLVEKSREKLALALSEISPQLSSIASYAQLIKGGLSEQNAKDAAATIAAESRKASAVVRAALGEGNKSR